MNIRISIIFLCLFSSSLIFAQTNNEVIQKIKELMTANYIFLDKAKLVNQHLDELVRDNYFDSYTQPKDFAKALTQELQKITKDKHLNIAPPRSRTATPPDRTSFDWHLQNLVRFREGGFGEVNFFQGNIAFVKLKGFRVEDTSKVSPLMNFISTADAVIFDLRGNGGGNGPVGLNLSSYFLPTNTPLSSVYERRKDLLEEYHTTDVKGKKQLDVPLFILIDKKTFSAAEAFAYDLQARKRAIVLGEVSGGGAHPVNFIRLPHGFRLIVPVARSINPITNSNWEGVGVIPDIIVTDEDALEIAKKVANESATKYRETPFNQLEEILKKNKITKTEENLVFDIFDRMIKRGHLESFMINRIGYDYLGGGFLQGALVVQKTAILMFPESPNAHDSYAEVLAKNNQKQLALSHYKKSVALAKQQQDERLKLFQKNLDDFQSKM